MSNEREGAVTLKGNPITLVGPELKVGDKVLFGKYAGTEVKVEGEDYMVMREEDIIGVVEA